jgi:hypothetical protein
MENSGDHVEDDIASSSQRVCQQFPRAPMRIKAALASVPIPKFANPRRTSDANFGIKGTLATHVSSAAFEPGVRNTLAAGLCELRVRGTSLTR